MKSKIQILTVLSSITLVIPIVGFSRSVKTVILFSLGIGGILLTISLRKNVRLLKLRLKRLENQSINTQ